MIRRIGTIVVGTVLLAAGVRSVYAQTPCQQVRIVTARTTSAPVVTPLDAIAFPVPPVASSVIVTRQISICPPGGTVILPIVPAPVTPVPVIASIVVPITTVPVLIWAPGVFADPRAMTPAAATPAPPGSPSAPQPASPAIVGTMPADTVRELAQHGDQYDRTVVTVAGTVGAVDQQVDATGDPITTFQLEARGAAIGAVARGRLALQAGQHVRVTGPFYVSTPFAGPSDAPWHHVIEAEVVER